MRGINAYHRRIRTPPECHWNFLDFRLRAKHEQVSEFLPNHLFRHLSERRTLLTNLTAQGAGDKPQSSAPSSEGWHVDVAPYLWFPGITGTVGALGHEAGVSVTAREFCLISILG